MLQAFFRLRGFSAPKTPQDDRTQKKTSSDFDQDQKNTSQSQFNDPFFRVFSYPQIFEGGGWNPGVEKQKKNRYTPEN